MARPSARWPLLTQIFSLLLMLMVTGCGQGDSPGSDRGAEPPPNVLLIVVDTLGARYLDRQDPGTSCSPAIDGLAVSGVQFQRAYSTAPWTQPAVASLFTSRMPSEHGVRRIFDKLDRRQPTLAEGLKSLGLRTCGVISHLVLGAEFGYARGFDRYLDSPVGGHRSVTSHEVTDLAISSLDELAGDPFFLFVHYFDPHWFYNHHPDFDRTSGYRGRLLPGMEIGSLRAIRDELTAEDIDYLSDLYREEIAYTDFHIGRLLAHLDEVGLGDDTLVILTADHGEEFMEHGWIGHTASLYEELIHVPLIFRLPGRLPACVVETPVSLLDVMPTVLDLVGLTEPDENWRGISLLQGMQTGAEPVLRPLFAEVSYTSPAGWPSGDDATKRYYLTAVVRGRQKLVRDVAAGTWTYFDLVADPLEMNGDWDADQAAQMELLTVLRGWDEPFTQGWPDELKSQLVIDPQAIQSLRSLGYVH